MPRLPRAAGGLVTRPPILCPCGTIFEPAPKGIIPTRCPRCQRRDKAVSSALSVLSAALADPTYRPLGAARVGEVLMALGRRWRSGERSLVDLWDALETLEIVIDQVEERDSGRVSRWLGMLRYRLEHRLGLTARQRRRAKIEGGGCS